MATFDFNADAELYPSRARASRRQPVGYKRFDHAADAIKFAIEELPPEALVGAYLEVGEERFDGQDIRRLYDREDYPLQRRKPQAGSPPVPATDATQARGFSSDPAHKKTVRWVRS